MSKNLIEPLCCPFCGDTDLATGPVWAVKSEDGEQEETLTEYICTECDHSFWA